MTDELFFSALPLLESLVLVGLLLFVEYTKLEELESYFSENEVVQRNKRFLVEKTATSTKRCE